MDTTSTTGGSSTTKDNILVAVPPPLVAPPLLVVPQQALLPSPPALPLLLQISHTIWRRHCRLCPPKDTGWWKTSNTPMPVSTYWKH